MGRVVDRGDGRYTWTGPAPAESQVAYITATDSNGLKGQIPFYLQVGPGEPGLPPAPRAPGPKDEAPVLEGLALTPKAFAAGRGTTKLRQAAASRRKRGAKIRFELSEPAAVRFTVERIRPRNPRVRAPSFSRQVLKAGKATVGFSARFAKAGALPPGKYRLTAAATDGGGLKSAPRMATFRIVR